MDENLIIPDSTSIAKTIYDLNEFNNVVDTSFSELAVTTNPDDVNVQPDLNVDQFFVEYDNLYYQIPPTGSVQSHLELAGRSLEAVGISLDDLQSEIEILRTENIDLKNQIIVLSQTNLGTLA
jgi:hypothetical protein